ncbi:forkhead box protein N2-like [Clytia hemisphaerica]|uniref:Fork-head domain-containing protein n=1 Tax=Clytia hemisphaerica TaxID=252671 RepID=A0A7M6DQB7_9CNID
MTVEIDRLTEPLQLKAQDLNPDRDFGDKIGNNENVSPSLCENELLVAVRPSNLIQTQLLNVNAPICKKIIENNVLAIRNLVSPPKRPIENNLSTSEEPQAKRTSLTPNLCAPIVSSQSLPNSPNRLLSQSAGNSSELQSAIKRVQNNLSQSCFADLRPKKHEDIDSDLTCLNWLQEGNLLNGFTPKKDEKGENSSEEENSVETVDASDLSLLVNDPLNSINEVDKSLRKPAYSFSTLIFMAIENAKDKRLPVKEIYQWIQDNFPYFQKAPIGWKNSVRHNLSLNKSFKKVDKEKCIGKGSLWTIDHEARAGLVQQLRKTATYHSYPYSRLPFTHRYYTKGGHVCKRDSTGRFLPNHDDAEFDVAAAMCSLSSSSIIPVGYEYKTVLKPGINNLHSSARPHHKTSFDLLKLWRTYFEPWNEFDSDDDNEDCKRDKFFSNSNSKYTIDNFLDQVRGKAPSSYHNKRMGQRLNTSSDADYEFFNSEDEDSSDDEDEEMKENMRRLVEKEKDDDGLFDSGYSEEGTLKSASSLDHSYSKSLQSLCRPQSKRESKGVAALLSLADAASKELENMSKDSGTSSPEKDITQKVISPVK